MHNFELVAEPNGRVLLPLVDDSVHQQLPG